MKRDESREQFAQAFGKHLKALRLAAGLTLRALGDRAGISTPQQLEAFESGKNIAGTYVTVRLAQALECSVDDLIPPAYRHVPRIGPKRPARKRAAPLGFLRAYAGQVSVAPYVGEIPVGQY